MLRSPWWSTGKFEQMAFQHKILLERKAAITWLPFQLQTQSLFFVVHWEFKAVILYFNERRKNLLVMEYNESRCA